ncbi:hypothetical protein ACN47E_008206 [Coniothyrium glycines]
MSSHDTGTLTLFIMTLALIGQLKSGSIRYDEVTYFESLNSVSSQTVLQTTRLSLQLNSKANHPSFHS